MVFEVFQLPDVVFAASVFDYHCFILNWTSNLIFCLPQYYLFKFDHSFNVSWRLLFGFSGYMELHGVYIVVLWSLLKIFQFLYLHGFCMEPVIYFTVVWCALNSCWIIIALDASVVFLWQAWINSFWCCGLVIACASQLSPRVAKCYS